MRRQQGLWRGRAERGEEEEKGDARRGKDSVALLKVIWISVFGQLISPIQEGDKSDGALFGRQVGEGR